MEATKLQFLNSEIITRESGEERNLLLKESSAYQIAKALYAPRAPRGKRGSNFIYLNNFAPIASPCDFGPTENNSKSICFMKAKNRSYRLFQIHGLENIFFFHRTALQIHNCCVHLKIISFCGHASWLPQKLQSSVVCSFQFLWMTLINHKLSAMKCTYSNFDDIKLALQHSRWGFIKSKCVMSRRIIIGGEW